MDEKNLSGEFVLTPVEKAPSEKNPEANNVLQAQKKSHGHNYTKAHFFSSLSHYPNNVMFRDQEADEEVVLLIRRDFITNAPWILASIGLFLLPILFLFISPVLPVFFQIPAPLLGVSLAFYYLVVASFILLQFTIWYFNVGIVTNKRIIDLDVANILVHELTEARLEAVQDITLIQVGGIRSIFHYGDIDIQTEALKQNLEFHRVPDPNFIRRVIGELIVDRQTT